MSLPPTYSHCREWDEAFARELDARTVLLNEPDPKQAAELVAEAEAAAWQAVRDFAAAAMVTEARRRVQDAEREQRRGEAQAKQRAQDEKDGRRALRKLFGRRVGNAIELWEPYVVIENGAFVFAIPEQHEARLRAALGGGIVVAQAEGIRLGKVLQKLDGGARLDGVLADDAAIDKAVQLVQRAEHERREAEAAALQAQAKARARKREEARLVLSYGTTLSDDDQ